MIRTFLLILLVLPLGGCGIIDLFIPLGNTRSRDFSRVKGISKTKIWEHLQEVVNEEYDIKLANDEILELESEWNEHLGPMFKMGRRYRVIARIVFDNMGLGVEVTVERGVNTNIRKPLSRLEADWEDDGRDKSRERKIIWGLTTRLVEFSPSNRVLNPDRSKYLTSEETKQEDDLWSDRPRKGGSKSPPRRSSSGGGELWKD